MAGGIYRNRHGRAATVNVKGVQLQVHFPPGTPLRIIRAKCDHLLASVQTFETAGWHTLHHDAERYLDQIESTLISLGDRSCELLALLPWFERLRTPALPAHRPMSNPQLHEWHRTLTVSTCHHCRDAMTNLGRVLYGRCALFDLLDLVRFAPPLRKPP